MLLDNVSPWTKRDPNNLKVNRLFSQKFHQMSVNFADILVIMEEWRTRYKAMRAHDKGHDYTNGPRLAGDIKELVKHLRVSEPILRAWMNSWLAANPEEVFLRSHASIATQWMKNQILEIHPTAELPVGFKECWDLIFADHQAHSFGLVEKLLTQAKSRIPNTFNSLIDQPELCDDLAIKALHEGIKCKYTDWIGCELCENQTDRWRQELLRRACSTHVLLGHDRYLGTLYSWKHYREFGVLPTNWKAFHHWHDNCDFRAHRSACCYNAEAYIIEAKSSISKTFASEGKTPVQASSNLSWYPSMARMDLWNFASKEYEVFETLWNRLDIISALLDDLEARADELLAMF